MDMADKIYAGNGRMVETKYGELYNISICLDDIPEEHIFTSEKTGKRYVKLKMTEKKEVDAYKNTHSVIVDTWKPDNGKGSRSRETNRYPKPSGNDGYSGGPEDFDGDDIPF
jgi:hypothetical protein